MANDDPKRRVRNRKGQRFGVKGDNQIVIYMGAQRLVGEIQDESESGLGATFSDVSSLKPKQRVHVIFRRNRRIASVAYLEQGDDHYRLGLRFEK